MKRRLAYLIIVCLLLTLPAAAQDESPVTLVCRSENGGYSLTLEGLEATVCALQLDLTLQGACPDAAFSADPSAYEPECEYQAESRAEVNGNQTAVTIYITAAKDVLTSAESLHLGTLKAVGNAALPEQADLILLNRSLETSAGTGTITVRTTGGTVTPPSGGGSGGGGGSRPSVKPGAVPETPSAPSSSAQGHFSDVPADAYYLNAVTWAVENGVTSGTGNGRFSPNDLCTRAQIVTFLCRAAGSPAADASSQFSDVPAGSYFENAVQWAVSQGITMGTGGGTFSPNQPCTRAQAVTFLYRANGSPNVTGGVRFADVPENAYYASAVQWAAANGITNGVNAQMFSPDAPCTRAQIVTFLFRNASAG